MINPFNPSPTGPLGSPTKNTPIGQNFDGTRTVVAVQEPQRAVIGGQRMSKLDVLRARLYPPSTPSNVGLNRGVEDDLPPRYTP